MDEKAKTFHNSGFVSTAIREIQRLLNDDEPVIIWKDEWTLMEGLYLSPKECEHHEDALQEWEDVVNPKE